MAWITPKITWIAGDGIGFSDMNRIEGNIKHVYETGVVPTGAWTITKTSGTAFQVGEDNDIVVEIGRGKLGFSAIRGVDAFTISHYDNQETVNYGIGFTTAETFINAATAISLKIADNNISTLSATLISFVKDVKIKASNFKIERTINTQNMSIDIEGGEAAYRSENPTSSAYQGHSFYSSNNVDEIILASLTDAKIDLYTNTRVVKSVTLGSSADIGVEMGAFNDTSVNVGAQHKWRNFVSGDATGQNLSIDYFVRGGSVWQNVMDISSSQVNIKRDVFINTNPAIGDSADTTLEIGALNETSVNAGAVYKWRNFVDGNANGQDWNLEYLVRGGSVWQNVLEVKGGEFNFNRPLNPTTTPTEQVVNFTTTTTAVIARGEYSVLLELSNTTGTTTIQLEKLIDGNWELVDGEVFSGVTGLKYVSLTEGAKSTGSDLRINYAATGTGTGRVVLRKY